MRSARAALPTGGEIIVVDDGSRIPAGAALAGHIGAETTVIDNPEQWGPSAARNAGEAEHLPRKCSQQEFDWFRDMLDKHGDLLEEYDPWLERAYRCRMWKHWLKMRARGLFNRSKRETVENNRARNCSPV